MALQKKFNEADYRKFESDLLFVLKKEPTHRLDFDGKLLIRSRRHDCLLAATDVFWDKNTGDIVLVGAFKSGAPVYDESRKELCIMRQRIEVPLKECFEDLKVSSGMEMRLLGKARKAVYDRYVGSKLNLFESRSLMRDGVLDLKYLGIGQFVKRSPDGEPTDRSIIEKVVRDPDGRTALVMSNSFGTYRWSMSTMPLAYIQVIGSELERVNRAYSEASDIFTSKMQELERKDMSYSQDESRRHRDTALVAVYKATASLDICNAVARTFAGSDIFDREVHQVKDIRAAVKRFRPGDLLTVERSSLQHVR